MPLCLFLSVCFHAIKGTSLEPTYFSFKSPFINSSTTKFTDLPPVLRSNFLALNLRAISRFLYKNSVSNAAINFLIDTHGEFVHLKNPDTLLLKIYDVLKMFLRSINYFWLNFLIGIVGTLPTFVVTVPSFQRYLKKIWIRVYVIICRCNNLHIRFP